MKLRNFTQHDVNLVNQEGTKITLHSEGNAVVVMQAGDKEWVTGLPVPIQQPSRVVGIEGLPEPEEGVIFITSMIVASEAAKQGRMDVVSPGTGPKDGAIRNEKGHIVGVTQLNRQ